MIVHKGRDFPKESELQYSEGILKTYSVRTSRGGSNNIIVLTPVGKMAGTEYFCNYSAYTNLITSFCPQNKTLQPYLGKMAKIGWYYQPDFLWLSNPNPQLVTLEVDGEVIRSYADTQRVIDEQYIWWALILLYGLGIFSFVYIFWAFGKFAEQHGYKELN
ncbi:MAG: hypothetical protein Q4C68_07135 [Moraxella sp.]|nr:hypothetical protein [Moraxella sp.]